MNYQYILNILIEKYIYLQPNKYSSLVESLAYLKWIPFQ